MKYMKGLMAWIFPITVTIIYLINRYIPVKKIITDFQGTTSPDDMNIRLERKIFTEISTIGEMYIDNVFFCYTLEDKVRDIKIPNITAIPYGTYDVELQYSNRFEKIMPRVLNVPNFSGILIHNGNYAGDTEGCILVGSTKGANFVGNSRVTLEKFFKKIENKKNIKLKII